MSSTNRIICAAVSLTAAYVLTGCGGGKEEALPAPPPPAPKAAEVKAAAPEAPAPTAPGAKDAKDAPAGGPPPVAAAPPVESGSTNDIFKGMSQRQIEEFKQSATPETHDMNLNSVQEAAYGYFNEYRRAPKDVKDLVDARYLPRLLAAPKGKKYVFDPKSAQVSTVNQ